MKRCLELSLVFLLATCLPALAERPAKLYTTCITAPTCT